MGNDIPKVSYDGKINIGNKGPLEFHWDRPRS